MKISIKSNDIFYILRRDSEKKSKRGEGDVNDGN